MALEKLDALLKRRHDLNRRIQRLNKVVNFGLYKIGNKQGEILEVFHPDPTYNLIRAAFVEELKSKQTERDAINVKLEAFNTLLED